MLLDDDVVTNGQAEASALSGGFSREEGIEHLFLDLGRNTCAVVPYPDLYPVTLLKRYIPHFLGKVFSAARQEHAPFPIGLDAWRERLSHIGYETGKD
jgi:hypothetical protein